MTETLDTDEVLLVRRRLALVNPGPDFGATEPLRADNLESVVGRQFVGWAGRLKYETPHEVAATLFYGLALNHPFENGNKRTALVSMLVLLNKNRVLLTNAGGVIASKQHSRSVGVSTGEGADGAGGVVVW